MSFLTVINDKIGCKCGGKIDYISNEQNDIYGMKCLGCHKEIYLSFIPPKYKIGDVVKIISLTRRLQHHAGMILGKSGTITQIHTGNSKHAFYYTLKMEKAGGSIPEKCLEVEYVDYDEIVLEKT